MEKTTITKDELDNLSKDMIVMLYLQLHENFQIISEQNTTIQKQNKQMLHMETVLVHKRKPRFNFSYMLEQLMHYPRNNVP